MEIILDLKEPESKCIVVVIRLLCEEKLHIKNLYIVKLFVLKKNITLNIVKICINKIKQIK